MKKIFVGALALLLSSGVLYAKNEVQYFDIQNAMNSPEFKAALDPKISFKFGSGSGKGHKIIVSKLMSNKKANGVGKNDEAACQRALLNALISFQERAIKEGGTKVVNITGYYYKQEYDSKEKFQCGVGNIMSGVTLRGDIAK